MLNSFFTLLLIQGLRLLIILRHRLLFGSLQNNNFDFKLKSFLSPLVVELGKFDKI